LEVLVRTNLIPNPAFWPTKYGKNRTVRSIFQGCFDLSGYRLHAYVLMDNHVHLLTTPPDIGAVARLMQKLGRGYVGQFNTCHQRTGTLWEGRYKASPVDSESYVLRCHRYIDPNPVRARMTDDPTTFAWSNCASHCGLRQEVILSPHPQYTALAATPESRAMALPSAVTRDPFRRRPGMHSELPPTTKSARPG